MRRIFDFILTLGLILLVAGCGLRASESEQEESAVPDSLIHVSVAAIDSHTIEIVTLRSHMLADTLVLSGEIAPDPLSIAHVSTRVSGTIQTVRVVAGDHVRPGEVLGTLYSPEFLALVGDYLLAHERAEKATNLASPDAGALQQVAESTRRRLELLGAPASLIERLHASHEMVNELPIASPSVGVITECEAAPGRHVEAGADLFGITNLSSVWTVAHAYERDLGRLRIGQNAKVIANAYPGRVFSARVASLDGSIDEVTRTLRVRLAVTNPDLSLRPGMFVSAHVATGSTREALVVSEGAVQQLGEPVVFVAISDTTFVARPIRSRPLGGNLVEVLEGLRAGERLATTGAFLLKSQALKGELGEE